MIATIFDSPSADSDGQPAIVATEHALLSAPSTDSSTKLEEEEEESAKWAEPPMWDGPMPSQTGPDALRGKTADFCEPSLIHPFAAASPIPEVAEESWESPHPVNQTMIESKAEETLSSSMQSLVDGLMSWGGGLDVDADHLVLPMGMAASITLEGSRA